MFLIYYFLAIVLCFYLFLIVGWFLINLLMFLAYYFVNQSTHEIAYYPYLYIYYYFLNNMLNNYKFFMINF